MATGSAEKVKMVRQLALGEWLRGECLPGLTLHRPFEAQGKLCATGLRSERAARGGTVNHAESIILRCG